MHDSDEFKVDKSAFSIVPLSQADDEVDYWLTKTPHERLRGLELTRQVLYGYDPSTARFQRLFAVVEREAG